MGSQKQTGPFLPYTMRENYGCEMRNRVMRRVIHILFAGDWRSITEELKNESTEILVLV